MAGVVWCGLLGLCLACPALAWQGTVTHVSDGDTVWVQPSRGGATRKVRLLGIDAPELCQRGGPESREALVAVLQGQAVEVQGRHRDTYGRLLAQLSRQGQDVGAWMVSQGHAWSYRHGRQPGVYEVLQTDAQAHRRGVFADAQALPPQLFRRRFGSCH